MFDVVGHTGRTATCIVPCGIEGKSDLRQNRPKIFQLSAAHPDRLG